MKWLRRTNLAEPGLGVVTWVLEASNGDKVLVQRHYVAVAPLSTSKKAGDWVDKGWTITIERRTSHGSFSTSGSLSTGLVNAYPKLQDAKDNAASFILSPSEQLALLEGTDEVASGD